MLPDQITRDAAYLAFCNMGVAYERALLSVGMSRDAARDLCCTMMNLALEAAVVPGETEAFSARLNTSREARRRTMI